MKRRQTREETVARMLAAAPVRRFLADRVDPDMRAAVIEGAREILLRPDAPRAESAGRACYVARAAIDRLVRLRADLEGEIVRLADRLREVRELEAEFADLYESLARSYVRELAEREDEPW